MEKHLKKINADEVVKNIKYLKRGELITKIKKKFRLFPMETKQQNAFSRGKPIPKTLKKNWFFDSI